MKKYRVGIIGLGRMGSTIDDEIVDYPAIMRPYSIASACVANERLELAAGSDLLPEKREAFNDRWGVHALYEDYHEMLEKERPDVVAICTKGENHAELTIQVAKTGVQMIFCEKAMACSMVEANAARDAVKAAGAKFLTGVLRRWHSRYREVRRRILAGDIRAPRTAIHYAPSSLLHGHVHSIDTLRYLLGDPEAETVWGELLPRDIKFIDGRIDQDPGAIYQIEFTSGMAAYSVPVGSWDFEVHGEDGVIRVANDGVHISIRKRLPLSGRFKPFMETGLPPPPLECSATVAMLEDLVTAYEERRPTEGDIDVTHHCTEILFAIAECHHLKLHRTSLPVRNRELYVYHV